MYESERISNSPIFEIYTEYLVELDFKQTAYSVFEPSKYTGEPNSNVVANEPSEDVCISAGFNAILDPGTILSDGTPFLIGLI